MTDQDKTALLSKLRAPVADNWQQYALPGETTAEQVCERMNAEVTRRTVAAMRASAPVAGNNMRNPNLSRQGGWIKTDGFFDFLILAGIIGAIVGGILIPEVISFLWDFAKPWIHEVTK